MLYQLEMKIKLSYDWIGPPDSAVSRLLLLARLSSPLQNHAVPSEQLRLSPANPCIDQDQGQQEGRTRLNFDGLNQVLNLGVPRAEQRIREVINTYIDTVQDVGILYTLRREAPGGSVSKVIHT
ncbi:hypothetical protein D6C84_06916 [Aureobasidium pullulans]|uniref:Uncharacterized protein n=1 Tax=Aureobasidium pullulans TaxID=5580 RepID=A0A4S9XMJ4_AURPU|nr:hypothetical protein D6C84_06916 [Aureobasidium pullulans]